MNEEHPIWRDFRWRVFYFATWVVIAVTQTLILSLSGIDFPFWLALLDSALFSLLFAFGIIPLWYPIRFNNPKGRRLLISLIPYTLLAAILITVWLITGSQLMKLLTNNPAYLSFLKISTGWRIIEGLLFYAVAILFYSQYAHIMQLAQKVSELQQVVEKRDTELSRITVKDRQQIHVITVGEIGYLEAYGDYVQLHTAKGVFLKEKTMKFFEEHLPSNLFVRIHRSYIVNINEVSKIELYEKERYRVYLKNGETLKASDTGYKLIRDCLKM